MNCLSMRISKVTRGVAKKGVGRVVRPPRQQSPRGGTMGSKINISNEKCDFFPQKISFIEIK